DRLEVADAPHHAVRVAAVRALAVAGDAGVGAHGDELPRAPARVDDERLDPGDLHGRALADQNTASGFAGEPVPPITRSGGITSMKSSRRSSTHALASGSSSALSTSATP